MTPTVPSRQALRHLARLCHTNTSAAPALCIASASHQPQLHTQNQRSSTPLKTRRYFSATPRTSFPPTTTTNTPQPSSSTSNPSAPLPDITTYYTLFPTTLPSGPPPSGPFIISLPHLRKEFLRLQSQHHPDKYATGSTAHQKSLALSALINQAYKTLSDPLSRAQYLLLTKYNIDVNSEDNSSHPTDQGTLMEVMEAQERIEEAEGEQEIEALKEENKVRLQETEEKLGRAFEEENVEVAKNECVRLKYWRSLQQGLDDWEPGKEVRLVH